VDQPEQLKDPAFAARYRDMLTRLMDSRVTILLDGTRTSIAWAGIDTLPERQSVRLTFHAGTARSGDSLVTSGGRVLGVTASADTLDAALAAVYRAISHIRFDGMHFRKDIGSGANRSRAAGD